jgi:hypothetical protein
MGGQRESVVVDFCVIGAGMAGLSAVLAAARQGLSVALVSDRPVLGGNASSEIRMWIRGASESFPYHREGGIVEEFSMDNIYYNPGMDYPMWDAVLYQKVAAEANIRLFLNTSCNGASYADGAVTAITAWQLTTYKTIEIAAAYFCDCSGDCVLAEFVPAKYRVGREARAEFDESAAVETADGKTMGNTCLFQVRETDAPKTYTPPDFAKKFNRDDFPYRLNTTSRTGFVFDNFWWMEIGGEGDSLRDAENLRHELLAIAYGTWDFIKNSGLYDSENWELDWLGFLPGKRESRRYIGDYILNQNDITGARVFDDEIAYGGWSMDDHNPAGFSTKEPPNTLHLKPELYSIPYRSIYSANVKNLFFAGRNISATHIACSSARVMATCAILGQAAGTAAAVAHRYGLTPREAGKRHIGEIQQRLRRDDCYLLGTPYRVSETMRLAKNNLSKRENTYFLSGTERKLAAADTVMTKPLGAAFDFVFEKDTPVRRIRLVLDNDIAREETLRFPPGSDPFCKRQYPQRCNLPLNREPARMPGTLLKAFSVEVKRGEQWEEIFSTADNHSRLVLIDVGKPIGGVRLVGRETYGAAEQRLLGIDVL